MMYDLAPLNPKRRGTQTGSIPFCKRNVSYEVCLMNYCLMDTPHGLIDVNLLGVKNAKKRKNV